MTASAERPPPTGASDDDGAEVVLREEQLRIGTEWVAVERVRLVRTVVTETVTLRVQRRREELRVERLPVRDGAPGPAGDLPGGAPPEPLVIVLHQEEPEVTLRTVPVERVRVHVDRRTRQQPVRAELRREEVEVLGVEGLGVEGIGVEGLGVEGLGVEGPSGRRPH